MATPDDFLSAQKNGVVGINTLVHTTQNLAGSINSLTLNAATTTFLPSAAGWVARVSVIVAGSSTGMIYDAASAAQAGNNNRLAVIPNTVGIFDVMMPVNNGIVVTTGTGQIVAVSYA